MASQARSVDFASLIYGSLVNSLLEMTENVEDVNMKLSEIGYRIGLRIAHDCARDKDVDRIETPEAVITNILIKNWPGLSGNSKARYTVVDDSNFTMSFDPSLYTQNVSIPEIYTGVKFAAILPGILRGIFEIFHYEVNVELCDPTPGTKGTDVKITVLKIIPVAVRKDED
jgi:hypothetical protein